MTLQLPLGLRLYDHSRFGNYHPGPNGEALHALRECAAGHGEHLIYLWGAAGLGKTHLLQAACAAADRRGAASAYLPFGEAGSFPVSALEGLEHQDLLCLDDLDAIAGRSDWEEALFHLFNRVREGGGRLVTAAARAPEALGLTLPDLASRLGWGLVYPLRRPDDAARLAALQLRARGRGLELPEETGNYLLRRCPRDLPALFSLLDRLDSASLAAQRRLTIPFVRDVLAVRERSRG